jgi:hypothetical protein
VLASNGLARALGPFYATGTNLVRAVFFDDRVRDMYEGYDTVTEITVAALRAVVGPDLDDPRLNELVGELSVRSDRFRRLWARHDSAPRRSGTARIHHPEVGLLELGYEKLAIPWADRQTLAMYYAEPGSPSAQGLALLATLAASEPER